MRISAALIVIAFALVPQAPKTGGWRFRSSARADAPLFGYIGQARTIPWNEGGRYVVALCTPFRIACRSPANRRTSC